jgi:hypothetical protein
VSILDPNREVAPNFAAWTAEPKDGEPVTTACSCANPTRP